MNKPAVVRAGYGLLQLAAAARAFTRLRNAPGRRVVRILGVRYLAQAASCAAEPTAAVMTVGVEVDLLHAARMLALAATSRQYRRAALTDAGVSMAFAVAGGIAAHRAAPHPPVGQRHGLRLRDRWAQSIAQRTLPGCLRQRRLPARA